MKIIVTFAGPNPGVWGTDRIFEAETFRVESGCIYLMNGEALVAGFAAGTWRYCRDAALEWPAAAPGAIL